MITERGARRSTTSRYAGSSMARSSHSVVTSLTRSDWPPRTALAVVAGRPVGAAGAEHGGADAQRHDEHGAVAQLLAHAHALFVARHGAELLLGDVAGDLRDAGSDDLAHPERRVDRDGPRVDVRAPHRGLRGLE